MEKAKLVIVYNAEKGFFNQVSDYAHKLFSPNTYSCQLCRLTYGPMTMKKEWKKFLDSLLLPLDFVYKEDFEQKYGREGSYPLIGMAIGGDFKVLLEKEAIEKVNNVRGLIVLLETKLKEVKS